MAAKKGATKKKTVGSKKRKVVNAKGHKAASRRSGKRPAQRVSAKPSSKKSVKRAPAKPVSKKKTPVQKLAPKASGQGRAKTAVKKPSLGKTATIQVSRPAARRSSASLLTGPMRGFAPYQPKRGEDYMSKGQLEHFRQILPAWKRELMEEVDRTMLHMKDEAANFPDPNDRATQESEFGLELRTRDRERKLLKKIDSALRRIEDGSYGYCEETGDEIGLRRLEARPVATLSVEAQERRELAERQFRDREDQYR
jgi:DnaK suppressor protein